MVNVLVHLRNGNDEVTYDLSDKSIKKVIINFAKAVLGFEVSSGNLSPAEATKNLRDVATTFIYLKCDEGNGR